MIEADKIKNKLQRERIKVINEINKEYSIKTLYPMLFDAVKEYVSRESKMIRPVLMVLIYGTYAKKYTKDLIRTALGFEFLHNCAVMHDDIIDDSKYRRGGFSLHKLYENMMKSEKLKDMKGKDLAIISGDIFYALGLKYFMEIKTDKKLKEKAMRHILDTAIRTGLGEFGELVMGLEDIKKIRKEKIIEIYDLKTSYYTFISPMCTGAILAKTSQKDICALNFIGKYIGRAFQIKNDIKDLDLKSKRKFEDIKKKNKTLLLYYAYKNAGPSQKKLIESIFIKDKPIYDDCIRLIKVYRETNTVIHAKRDIQQNMMKAYAHIDALKITISEKEQLKEYFAYLLEQ